MGRRLIFQMIILITVCAFSCDDKGDIQEEPEYEGPLLESYNVINMISDSAQVKIRIQGPVQLTLQNNDLEYPDGVFIEFFDEEGKVKSTITANRGKYLSQENKYKVEEDVEVYNFANEEKLNSEELFWDPKDQKVYTEKFVNITTQTKIIKGVGLVADQDFSSYQIGKITGTIYLEEDF